MSRTHRRHDPAMIRYVRRAAKEDAPINVGQSYHRRNAGILRGDDGRMSYDKCQSAAIDSEGGYKLDTWSECHAKHHGKEATRRLRISGKILAKRQMEDIE